MRKKNQETEETNIPEWVDYCLTLIEGKHNIYGRKMTDDTEELFENSLKHFCPEMGPKAVTLALLKKSGVPDISDLCYEHACLVSPAPDWEDAWREVATKMGQAGKQTLSHPAIAEAAADMGGLDSLWHAYRWDNPGTPLSILRSQFQKIYEAGLKARRLQVVEIVATIGIPAGRVRFPQLLPSLETVQDARNAARMRYAVTLPENGSVLRQAHEEHERKVKRLEAQPLAPNVREYIQGIRKRANLGGGGGPYEQETKEQDGRTPGLPPGQDTEKKSGQLSKIL